MAQRILVINDTQEILELFDDLLTEEGFEVVLYSFGIRDLKEVERVNPDLIILDLIFGGEDIGWQMLQKLKMSKKTTSIPVIVCTAAIKSAQEMEGYLKSKGIGLVLKPFDVDDLLLAVNSLLKPNQLHSTTDSYGTTTKRRPASRKKTSSKESAASKDGSPANDG